MGTIKDFFDSVNMVKFYKNMSRNPLKYFRIFYMKIKLKLTIKKMESFNLPAIDVSNIKEFCTIYHSMSDKIWFPEVNTKPSEDLETCTLYIKSNQKLITITVTNNKISNIYTMIKYDNRLPVTFASTDILINTSNESKDGDIILIGISDIVRKILLSYLKEYVKLI